MSRIIAGTAGGRTLASVPGDHTRPTTDRVKESLFSALEAADAIRGALVLDLFAGSGALGLEALSRGARRATLVESARRAADVCRRNARLLQAELGPAAVRVRQEKAATFLADPDPHGWDLVFLDPPYSVPEPELAGVLGLLRPALPAGALVVVERSSRSPEPAWPDGLVPVRDRKYGETRLWYAQPA
ncbi:16S rRNA (guanine(966)-N(2))-methyltransferase RsmD [Tersicoccus phoenicis]|uniref:16S rRNA (Guanine(966)-N(2))-methyltransferase RsmD n=1 Tax=Tersicoccus phoenicis TaxID=554083 RepID=A0A1R1LLJ3_9MICC|nr:16S rRNA (guanine(966)-N(2))-methyltransferase RsmD [Tersicoccus phoenicis]OMH28346.1 16S rRNA (guanine(966)-N(2))-methyltransferase RsmD [Tersicoccus phoenicis]